MGTYSFSYYIEVVRESQHWLLYVRFSERPLCQKNVKDFELQSHSRSEQKPVLMNVLIGFQIVPYMAC